MSAKPNTKSTRPRTVTVVRCRSCRCKIYVVPGESCTCLECRLAATTLTPRARTEFAAAARAYYSGGDRQRSSGRKYVGPS